MPRFTKYLVLLISFGNLTAIFLGESWYPFYDVGMFRKGAEFSNTEKKIYSLKYYYKRNDKIEIVDLRKEAIPFLTDNYSLRRGQEFAFSATYHNKGQESNYEHLLSILKKRGIDQVWVGIQSVDFRTKKVTFDTDPCLSIEINSSKKIYYGPLYIPPHQTKDCP